MTQKEAIIHVLKEFGGRANLTDVYPRVINLSVFKEDSDKKATIRTTLQRHPELFRQSPQKKGCWELVSYQEEVATLKKKVDNLERQVKHYMSIPKEENQNRPEFFTRKNSACYLQYQHRYQNIVSLSRITCKSTGVYT